MYEVKYRINGKQKRLFSNKRLYILKPDTLFAPNKRSLDVYIHRLHNKLVSSRSDKKKKIQLTLLGSSLVNLRLTSSITLSLPLDRLRHRRYEAIGHLRRSDRLLHDLLGLLQSLIRRSHGSSILRIEKETDGQPNSSGQDRNLEPEAASPRKRHHLCCFRFLSLSQIYTMMNTLDPTRRTRSIIFSLDCRCRYLSDISSTCRGRRGPQA